MSTLGRKRFNCQQCERSYSSMWLMKNHQRRDHEGAQLAKFTCADCGKELVSAGNLTRHINTLHKSERKHICDICEKGFVSRWQLVRHSDLQHNDPRFKCSDCGKSFSLKTYLDRHRASCSKKESSTTTNRLQCKLCPRTYRTKRYLSSHIASTHSSTPTTFMCDVCGDSFCRQFTLTRHVANKHQDDEK